MRYSAAPRKLNLQFCLHLALMAVISASIVSTPVKGAAQSLQQVQERLREQMERQQEAQREREQEREAEQERERQQAQQEQERQAEQERQQQERQQEAERERQQQEQQQAERERQQQEQQQQAERARQLQIEQAEEQARRLRTDPEPPVQRRIEPVLPVNPVRVPIITDPFYPRPPVQPLPPTVFVTRPQPPITVVVPTEVNTLNPVQANVVLQEILSTEAAEVQAATNGIDQIILALIQNSSNADLAKALQNRMNQPDLMQETLNDQLAGLSAISLANANRACASACANSSEVQRLSAQCNGGSQAACYQAAASLCQCSISNGGCGADTNQLQACVQQNTQSANSMRSSGTLNFSTSPGSMGGAQSPNAGGQNPGSNSSGCSSSWSACPAD